MVNVNPEQLIDFNNYKIEAKEIKAQLNLTAHIPNLKTNATTAENSITEDFNELAQTVSESVSWFFSAIVEEEIDPAAEETNEIKEKLALLAKGADSIQTEQELIEEKVSEIQAEMNVHHDDCYYQEKGQAMILESELQFLMNHQKLLTNAKEQALYLNRLAELNNPSQHIDPAIFENKIEAVERLIEEIRQTIEESKNKTETESESPLTAVAGLITNAAQAVQDDVTEFGQLAMADFRSGAEQLKESLDITKNLPSLDKEQIEKFILSKIAQFPAETKVIANILAVSIGTAVGGAAGGFAAKTAVDKILQELLPEDAAPETTAGKITAGILEAAGAFCIGGKKAAAVSGGSTVMKEVAPESVQAAVEVAATAYAAKQTGIPLATGLSLAIGAQLVLKNLSVLNSIKNDLGHAWKVCKESPLQVPKKFSLFIVEQGKQQLYGTVNAIAEGKKIEAITRIAGISLGVLALVYNVYTLPLNLTLFYLINKVYEAKEEKPKATQEADLVAVAV